MASTNDSEYFPMVWEISSTASHHPNFSHPDGGKYMNGPVQNSTGFLLSNSSQGNETFFMNASDRIAPPLPDTWLISVLCISTLLGLVILATVVGNVFVIAAIFLEKNLQTVGNYLVLSLAVADLMVACLVMPMGALYEVTQEWILGPQLCEVWTSCDVLCCTASILHLVAIALDRFWAVTNVDYIRKRSSRRIGIMIFLVWLVGFLVSLAPILGWKDDDFLQRIEREKRCMVSQDTAYQVLATCFSFYLPLFAILILYWRIYQVARTRIRHKPGSKAAVQPEKTVPSCIEAEMTVVSSTFQSQPTVVNGNASDVQAKDESTQPMLPKKKPKPHKESVEAKRERKAAKTLAIITGVFVICWLPFFVTAFLMAVCRTCEPDGYVFSVFLWLGYANSTLNPIIYTIFSPDFRRAFKRVLCGKKRGHIR